MREKRSLFVQIILSCSLILALGILPLKSIHLGKNQHPFKPIIQAGHAVNISSSGANSIDPEIVAGNGGKAYVVWVDEGNPKQLWFNSNENGGWGNKKNVSDRFSLGSGEGGRPCLVIDKTGRIHFVYQGKADSGNYEIFYNSSKNLVWSGIENASNTDGGVEWGGSNYPTVDVSPTNFYRYAVWMDDSNAPDSWQLFFRYKSPDMTSWSSLIVLPTYSSCYEPEITVDGSGTAHLIYTRRAFGSAVVWYTSNSNPIDSKSWTQPIAISGQTQIDFPEATAISDNFGNVFVIWPNMSGGHADIYFRKKVNGNWSEIENVSKTAGESLYPDVAVDKATGNFCVVWQERVNNVWQIYFKYFQNGQWSSSQNISDSSADSIDPTVYVDDLGQVHVAYSARVNGQYDIFYSGTGSAPPPVVYPPINVTVESKLGDSPHKKNNTIAWEANPSNQGLKIINYKVYRKKEGQSDSKFTLLATVGASVRHYRDNDLPNNQRFTYNLTTVAEGGQESAGSEEVTDEIVNPPIYPPLNPAVQSKLAESWNKKNNTLTWQRNPENENSNVKSYKIYRRNAEQSSKEFALVATVSPNTFQHEDKGLPNDQRFTYVLTTLAVWDRESLYSAAITDTVIYPPIYPPLSLAVQSKLAESWNKKNNTLTWQRNPENENSNVKSYKIYRRNAEQSSKEFALVATVSPNTFQHEDKGLPNDQRFTYVLTTLAVWDRESLHSAAITDSAVYAPTYPPLDVSLQSMLDGSETRKINIITWKANSNNKNLPLKSYRIYRKENGQGDENLALLASVSMNTYLYEDNNLPTTKKFLYTLTVVPQWGIESEKAVPAYEEWVFPPVDVTLETKVNDSLFFDEKINTVKWKRNPLNDASSVTNYVLYRKKVGQSDQEFVGQLKFNSDVFEYRDRGVPLTDKFVYALSAVDQVGNESKKSPTAGEK